MFYTHHQLDRADHLRKNSTAQSELLNSKHAKVLLVWQGKQLVGDSADAQTHMLTIAANTKDNAPHEKLFLGLIDQQAIFAISISELDESSLKHWLAIAQSQNSQASNIRFEDLRALGSVLPADEAALMAYARGLTSWHDGCRFCSRCGGALSSINAGHIKTCSTESCGYQSFPRTDSAVIMLVTQAATQDSSALCLLGRNHAWPPGVYSTLAGFVETGESLEHAVQREVFEEVNITTENVLYIASQPWPFPRSIMLGFEATATSSEITCDPHEIEDAQWFTVEQLKTFGTWGDEDDGYKLPRTDSIARFLIDRWIAEQ